MRLKIRCDGESEKFCKIFWELNKALTTQMSNVNKLFFRVVLSQIFSIFLTESIEKYQSL